jgi:hypothetical protein
MELGKLIYNKNSEEGEIKLDWGNMPEGVVGLDILSDWIAELTKVYNRELNHVFTTNKLTGVNK